MVTKTHKADGLYYVNIRMLRKSGACEASRRAFTAAMGDGNIPITLANIQAYLDRSGRSEVDLDIAVGKMRDAGHISSQEYWDFPVLPTPRQFMNLLAKRAKREGKL